MFAPPNVANAKAGKATQAISTSITPKEGTTPPSSKMDGATVENQFENYRRKNELTLSVSTPVLLEDDEIDKRATNRSKSVENTQIQEFGNTPPTPECSIKELVPSLKEGKSEQDISELGGISMASTVSLQTIKNSKTNISPSTTPLPPEPKKKNKKNRKSAWFNLISPSYKSKCEDFRRLFKDVPDTEMLVVDYSCALQRDILVHGRLYVTQNHLCFYANIFKWETTVVIKCKDITSMTKEKTALVIPNAIQCSTETGEKYFFTSFAARDKTYLMLFRIWQNALLSQPMTTSECWRWIHYSYGDELGLTSDDEDYFPPEDLESTRSLDLKANCEVSVEEGELAQPDSARCSPRNMLKPSSPLLDDGKSSSSDEAEDDSSTCGHNHSDMEPYLNQSFEMDVDHTFTCLFTASEFFEEFQKNHRKAYNLNVGNWERTNGDYKQQRQLDYWLPLNMTLAKSCSVSEIQKLHKYSKAGKIYSILCEISNGSVPYSDSYVLYTHFCLQSEGPNKCRLKIFNKLSFRKSLWGWIKTMIEKSAIQGYTGYATDLRNALEDEEKRYATETGQALPLQEKGDKLVTTMPELNESISNTRQLLPNWPTRTSVLYLSLFFLLLLNVYLLWVNFSLTRQENPEIIFNGELPSTVEQCQQLYKQSQIQHERQLHSLQKLVERTLTGLEKTRETYEKILQDITQRTADVSSKITEKNEL